MSVIGDNKAEIGLMVNLAALPEDYTAITVIKPRLQKW